jgi:hypothetical protein
MLGLTKDMARELGPKGIRVNAVAPGMVDTEIRGDLMSQEIFDKILSSIPMGRIASPTEIGNIFLFLASDLASFINGAVVGVDGGGPLPVGDFLADDASPAPEAVPVRDHSAALARLEGLPTAELQRLFTETLDACSHRFDAWATSVATQRLEEMRERDPTGIHVGAYGWVGIFFVMSAEIGGPKDAGLLSGMAFTSIVVGLLSGPALFGLLEAPNLVGKLLQLAPGDVGGVKRHDVDPACELLRERTEQVAADERCGQAQVAGVLERERHGRLGHVRAVHPGARHLVGDREGDRPSTGGEVHRDRAPAPPQAPDRSAGRTPHQDRWGDRGSPPDPSEWKPAEPPDGTGESGERRTERRPV